METVEKPAEERVLVCALAKHRDCIIPGSVKGKYCHQCIEEIMVAPSGQAYLRDHPETKTICIICLLKSRNLLDKLDKFEAAPGAIEEFMKFRDQ